MRGERPIRGETHRRPVRCIPARGGLERRVAFAQNCSAMPAHLRAHPRAWGGDRRLLGCALDNGASPCVGNRLLLALDTAISERCIFVRGGEISARTAAVDLVPVHPRAWGRAAGGSTELPCSYGASPCVVEEIRLLRTSRPGGASFDMPALVHPSAWGVENRRWVIVGVDVERCIPVRGGESSLAFAEWASAPVHLPCDGKGVRGGVGNSSLCGTSLDVGKISLRHRHQIRCAQRIACVWKICAGAAVGSCPGRSIPVREGRTAILSRPRSSHQHRRIHVREGEPGSTMRPPRSTPVHLVREEET